MKCPCLKCGKVLTAEYGLALHTEWVSREQADLWRGNVALYEEVEKERTRLHDKMARDMGSRPSNTKVNHE